MKLVKAKIEIVFEVPDTSEGYMCDAVSAILSEHLVVDEIIVDWQYSPNTKPEFIGEFSPLYDEGDAFN